MKYILCLLFGVCVSGTAFAGDADSLFFLSPLSATGYSGASVKKVGENLPLWVPPVEGGGAKPVANAAENSASMFSIGTSNLGVGFGFSAYPDKILSSPSFYSFFNEGGSSTLFLTDAVSDSLIDSMIANSVHAPFKVKQVNSFNHVRTQYGVRFNMQPILNALGVGFAVNPFIGASAVADVSFGTTKITPLDSLGFASSAVDSGFKGFDSTYQRIFIDAGFAIPLGVEAFPFKKTDIPIIKDLGISFTYTAYTMYRTFAYPGKDLNPYSDYINYLSNNSSNNSSSNNNSNNNTSNNGSSIVGSGSGSGDSKGGPPIWTGWSKISVKNEFRVCLELMF